MSSYQAGWTQIPDTQPISEEPSTPVVPNAAGNARNDHEAVQSQQVEPETNPDSIDNKQRPPPRKRKQDLQVNTNTVKRARNRNTKAVGNITPTESRPDHADKETRKTAAKVLKTKNPKPKTNVKRSLKPLEARQTSKNQVKKPKSRVTKKLISKRIYADPIPDTSMSCSCEFQTTSETPEFAIACHFCDRWFHSSCAG